MLSRCQKLLFLQRRGTFINAVPSLTRINKFNNVNVSENDFKLPYFPLKRIDFSNKTYYPIFQLSDEGQDSNWFKRAFLTSYIIPGAYFANFVFFLDWSYAPHYVLMAALFAVASKRMGRYLQTMAVQLQELHIGRSGEHFTAVLQKSFFSSNFASSSNVDINSSIHANDRVAIEFHIRDVKKITYLNKYVKHFLNQNDGNYEEKMEKKEEKSWQEFYGTSKDNSPSNAPILQDGVIVFEIEREGETPLVFTLDAGMNVNKGYNDYIAAFAEKRKIIIKEKGGAA
jgi:hypothetical protein